MPPSVRAPAQTLAVKLAASLPSEKIVIPLIFITDGVNRSLAVGAIKSRAGDMITMPPLPEALHKSIAQALERDTCVRQEEAQRGKITARLIQLTPCER